MSLAKINLRKLLQYFFSNPKLRRSLLLADIRQERSKEDFKSSDGGDFYGAFWSDAKGHTAGKLDITEATEKRIADSKARARLYPLLRDGFLEMWGEKMRWRNEPFEFVAESVKAQLSIEELGTVVKIENTASVIIADGSHRIIYPYFSEEPRLPDEAARLGFWVLAKALPNFDANDFRIIDMQHRGYFRPSDVGIQGDEEEQFLKRYRSLIADRAKLESER